MKAEARIKEIFAQALERKSPAERDNYLVEACQGDPELRHEIESLLRAGEQAGDFLGKTMQLPQPDFTVERTGTMIGRYKLLQKIGEGGFGVVYMAEQVEPVQRNVAIKIIKAGMDTREVVARFEAERQALALMDHPNIAKVFDAGATEAGRPYFVMELVNGIPITEYCDREQLSTAERLRLFMKVCHAVQHAHQKGIIHRDIKPNNVLVTLHDGEPVPKVIDFGVAKALGQKLTEKTLFTAFQHMIGTPAYMSPEQAELSGLDIDTRADIYSLGVLLYELLTGVTPFDAETLRKAALDEVRRMIRETEPPKPSTRLQTLGDKLTDVAKRRQTEPQALRRLVRGDLDWIVMKCLEKDRKRRYETADALVTDVLRHLRSHPILARPPTMLYAFGKHLHRHPLRVAVTSAAVITLVLSGVAAYLVEWRRGESYRRLAEENRRLAMESRERLARVYAGNGVRTVDDGDPLASLAWFAEALKVRRDGPVRDDRVRIATILRQSPRLVHAWTHNGPVDFVGISKDGKLAASASRDHTARVWNLADGEPVTPPLIHSNAVTCVCFSPDSKLLLTAGKDGVARVWDVLTGQPMCEPLVHPGSVEHAAYSPLGNLVATAGGDGAARLWNPATGKQAVPEMRHAASLFSVSFSEDGQWLATASSDGTARVWDVATGKPRTPPLRHKAGVLTARFNSEGSQLVTGSYDSTARVWDAMTGEAICVLDQGPVGWVPSALFSRDGKSVYTGGGVNGAGRVCVWEVPSGRLLMNKAGGSQVLLALPCRDGRYIITTSLTGDAKVWDAGSGRIALPSLKHGGVVNHAVLHPDDHRLLTAGNDGVFRVWDLWPEQSFLPCNDAPSSVVNVSPDGAYLAGFNRRGELEVWDTVKWKLQGSSLSVTNSIRYASLSSDAERLLVVTASNGNDLMAAVWQLGASRLLYECRVPSGGARLFSASADCTHLAIARDQSDEVWDLTHSKKLWGPLSHASRVSALQFSPRRDQLITGYGSTLHVCEGTTGKALFDIQQDVNLSFACFSPDGSWIATGCGDANTDLREAKLWSASTGEVFGPAMKHPFGVGWIAFSPDGRRVGTVGTHLARVWDVKTREPVSPPLHYLNIRFLRFSPDGNHVITASEDAARVWNIETGEPLTPLLPHEKISGAYFLGHGECAVTLGASGAKFWDLSPDLRPIDDLIALAWAHASRKVDATGSPAPLQPAEMEAAWLRARAAAKR